jgi:hypothetical protein
MKFQVTEEKAGTTQRCPACNALVDVAGKLKWGPTRMEWIVIVLVAMALLGILFSVLGKDADSAFGPPVAPSRATGS